MVYLFALITMNITGHAFQNFLSHAQINYVKYNILLTGLPLREGKKPIDFSRFTLIWNKILKPQKMVWAALTYQRGRRYKNILIL